MKLTIVLFIVALLQAHASTYAQNVNISVKNASLSSVFKELHKQTGFDFVYDNKLLKQAKPVSLNRLNISLPDVLNECFSQQPFSYKIIDNMIVVVKKSADLTTAKAIAINIRGKVKDETGAPLPGVTVKLKGTNNATNTDKDGNYSIALPNEMGTLVFTAVGFLQQEIPVNSNSRIDVTLRSSSTQLNEVVVVSVGYGTLNQKEVSSAISHVSAKDLLNVASNNPLMSLQGKVPGLTISNTGAADPNSNPSVQLRGVSSRNAGLGPLYVINNVPGGNLENINQNDIESIDVLKGGAASAIYGTRGSNGVIIITTKKGSSQSRMFYEGYSSFDFATNRLDLLSKDAFIADRVKHNPTQAQDYGGNSDWVDAVTKSPAFGQKHTFQLSGGGSKTNYFASADYRNANGIDLRSGRQSYGSRINVNHTSADNIFSASITVAPRYINSKSADYGGFKNALTLNPTIPIYDKEGKYNFINVGSFQGANPVEVANIVKANQEIKQLDINGSFKVNILPNLNTMVTVSEVSSSIKDQNFSPSTLTSIVHSGQITKTNYASQTQTEYDTKNIEWTGNYSLTLQKHNFKLLGGYSFSNYTTEQFSATNYDFPFDSFLWNNLGSGLYNGGAAGQGSGAVGSTQSSSRLIAFFGRLNYDFDGKYIFTASLRHEGSSKFGVGNKWGNFPAASAAWRVTEERFLKNRYEWLNDLKLRADYGVTGNQDFDPYKSLLLYGSFGYFPYNGTTYQVYGPVQNVNPFLGWEKAINFNAGLDFTLFDNRFSGSVNYYVRTNKDLLGDYDVPVPPNPRPTTYTNVGTIKNTGWELQLNGSVVKGRNFSYDLSFAGAVNNNKFVSFSNDLYHGAPFQDVANLPAPGSPGMIQRIQEGQRIGSFYTYRSAGVKDGVLQVYKKDGSIVAGNLASNDDKQFVGNGMPKFTASLQNTFRYKNFDLSIFLRGNFDYDIFNIYAFYIGTPAAQTDANVLTSAYNSKSKYSKLTSSTTTSIASDYFLEPGSFVKVDNVALGYTFKPVSSKHFHSIRIYATGRNLKTFTKYTGGDPDLVQVNGLTPGVNLDRSGNPALDYFPSTLQLIIGAQITF
ncbi:MAG: SusC/RagA family TonB-linked outer membrane protein [Mucilaginibacter sp.]|uniref:SusC/RagA family TonB-linked outer membrane protein n=1 Tax=Mucilaginibacter sp. TaxID=1882438 RepID=UPI0031A94CF9